jgi:dimethylaniline monooxygenase (N-oxide forming)
VLVVGIGNSAVDIAVDLCKRASHVALSTRSGAHIMPKYLMGIPVDRWSAFLTRSLKLPTVFARRIMARLIYLAVGDQARFGAPKPKHPMWREHATLSQELLPYAGHGWLSFRPNIETLDGDAVVFADGRRETFDAIIYATGYKTSFPFLAPEIFAVPENGGMVDLYRRITPPNQPGLFFAGLVQPIGPTIPLVEIQARWIAAVLSGKVALPEVANDMALEVRGFLSGPSAHLADLAALHAGSRLQELCRRTERRHRHCCARTIGGGVGALTLPFTFREMRGASGRRAASSDRTAGFVRRCG